jgi:hypothetical protein
LNTISGQKYATSQKMFKKLSEKPDAEVLVSEQ